MKKIIFLVVGLIIGALLTGIIIWNQMPKMMLVTMESKYDFETTEEKLRDSIFATGTWEVVEDIDIQDRLFYMDEQFRKMKVIGMCNANHSYNIFQEDENKKVGAFMPCRFAIYETLDGTVKISKMNIGLMSKMFGGLIQRVMGEVAEEEKTMLEGIIK